LDSFSRDLKSQLIGEKTAPIPEEPQVRYSKMNDENSGIMKSESDTAHAANQERGSPLQQMECVAVCPDSQ
jgi:hypothetical protein